jgi:MOSC domain-containing protein YiiM
MQAQPGVARDPGVLRAIVRDSEQNMGMYAGVTRPGVVREGDAVELLPA